MINVKSKLTQETIKIIKEIDNKAFIVIRDTKIIYNGYIK